MNDFREYSNYLEHYGIKGMHWGIRRYQNKDGTLTLRGKQKAREEKSRELSDLDNYYEGAKYNLNHDNKRLTKKADKYQLKSQNSKKPDKYLKKIEKINKLKERNNKRIEAIDKVKEKEIKFVQDMEWKDLVDIRRKQGFTQAALDILAFALDQPLVRVLPKNLSDRSDILDEMSKGDRKVRRDLQRWTERYN